MNKQTEETYEIAKKMILHKVAKGNLSLEKIKQIQQVMDGIPVLQNKDTEEYLKATGSRAMCNVSRDYGYAMLLPSDVNANVEDIATIIHELAHVFSNKISINKVGTLRMNTIIEEGMAENFSEACINEWIKDYGEILGEKVENGYKDDINVYTEERNILNALFFAISDDNTDDRAMEEYLFGDKSRFTDICAGKLGEQFYSIIETMENEINKRNLSSDGFGFRERNAIKKVCSRMEQMLMPMIPAHKVRQVNENSRDMKIKQVRYLSLSPMIRKAEKEQTLNENREEYLREWELETGYSYEELDETLSLEFIDMFSKSNDKKTFIRNVITYQREIGYTVKELLDIGFHESEISDILYCDEEQREGNIKLRRAGINYTMQELLDSGFSVYEIDELLGNNISNQESKKRIEHEYDRKQFISIITDVYLPAIDSNCSLERTKQLIQDMTKEELSSKGFSDSEIEEIIVDVTKPVAYREEQKRKWEEEVGYTTEELLKQGFTNSEIYELQANFDAKTGERLDRRLRAKQAIKDKTERNEGNVTMRSLVKDTLQVEPTRRGEVDEADRMEREEAMQEKLKEGVSLDD